MPNSTNKSGTARRSRRSTPTSPPDLPPVEHLRAGVVLGRVRVSPAVAQALSALAFDSVPETWRGRA